MMDWLSLQHKPTIGLVVQRGYGAGRQRWICQSPFVSFLSLNRPPSAPWQTPEKPFTVQAIWTSQRRANFMGTESEAGSKLEKKKKKSRGGCFSVKERLGVCSMAAQQWHTDHTVSHTHTNAAMHWCTQAVNSRQTPSRRTHTHTHTHTHTCTGVWLWVSGMRV